MQLRGYQEEAIAALETDWSNGLHKLGVAAPTGVGKTVIMAALAHRNHRGRVLITVHRDELVQQTVDKLRRIDPALSVGIVKAAMNQAGADVVVASVQTISRPQRLAQLGRFGLVIVDEAHRSMSDSYQRVLATLDPDGSLRVAGFTATWSRSDSRGLGDYWQKISWQRSIRWAIANGHLVRPIGKRVVTDLDLSRVKRTGGDYNEGELGVVMTDESILAAVVDAYTRHAKDRPGVLFAPTVASAEFYAAGLTAAGFPSEGVFGATGTTATRDIYRRFERGDTQILCTCVKLAEGWDAPWCSAAVLCRPTLHSGLFIQQVGRVLRPHPGKTDAIILDVVGTTDRHSLVAETHLGTTPPPRDDDEDFDLEDALQEDDEDADPLAPAKVDARVAGYEEVDLLAASGLHWLHTYRGTPFVRARDSTTFFLWPDGGSWAVGVLPQGRLDRGQWLAHGLDPEAALDFVSEYAVRWPGTSLRTAKSRPRTEPSSRQTEYALSLGLDPTGLTKPELSDAIDICLTTRLLEVLVA